MLAATEATEAHPDAADSEPELDLELEAELASFSLLGKESAGDQIPGQLDLTKLTTDLLDDHSEGNR